MFKISNLIQKVDHFYHTATNEYKLMKLAADPPQTWSMPDDDDDEPVTNRTPGQTDLYNQLQDLARIIDDPDASSEALLIADMYRKAIQINGGFNYVKKAIGSFINTQLDDLDPDDEENPLNELENVLNDVHRDLTKRATAAGGGFNKGDDSAAEREIRAVKNQFNDAALKEELEGRNKSTSDLSDISGDPNAAAKFDMSGGVGMEEAQSKGRGYFVRTQKDPKDWIQSYENEKQRYLEELATDKDPKTIERKRKIISILDQMKTLTAQEAILFGQIQVAPDEANQKELDTIKNKLKAFRKERAANKAALRQNALSRQTDVLMQQYSVAKSQSEKDRLKQEILLRQNLRSPDKKKGAETKLRKQVIAFLATMSDNPSPGVKKTLDNLLQKVQDAAAQKIPIKEWNRLQALEVAKKMQKIEVSPELQKAREEAGLRRLKTKNVPGAREWANINLIGYAENLSKAMLAERKTAKDRLVGSKNKKVQEEKKAKFKPYLDAIADATKASDRSSMKRAVSALRAAIENEVHLLPEFTQFVLSVRLSRSFHKFKDDLTTLSKLGIENKPTINDKEIQFAKQVIALGNKLTDYFAELEIKSIGPKGTNARGPSGVAYNNPYATQINIIRNAVIYITNILERNGAEADSSSQIDEGEQDVGPEKYDDVTGEVLYRKINPATGKITYVSIEDK